MKILLLSAGFWNSNWPGSGRISNVLLRLSVNSSVLGLMLDIENGEDEGITMIAETADKLLTVEIFGAGRCHNLLFFAPTFAAGSVLKY